MKFLFVALTALVVFEGSLLSHCVADDGDCPATISVVGKATSKVVPDEISFRVSVTHRAKTIDEAATQSRATMSQIIDLLRKSGLNEKDYRTDLIDAKPIHQRQVRQKAFANDDPFGGNQRAQAQVQSPDQLLRKTNPIGFSATRRIHILLQDVEKFETLHSQLLKLDVDSIDDVEMTSSKMEEVSRTTGLAAIKAARVNATELSEALGAKLKAVRSIYAVDVSYGPESMVDDPFGSSDSTPAIAAGVIPIRAEVRVVFELAETEL